MYVGHRRDLAATLPGAAVAAAVTIRALAQPSALRGIHTYTGIGYDDGVYLGSALRLTEGVLPWRDVALLHPPGATWLLVPSAILGHATDTQTALIVTRALLPLLAAACAVVAGLVVRHRGPLATATAALVLGAFPTAIGATHTLLLEPPLTLACLVGLCLAFQGGRPAGSRRLTWAGVALGFACAIKVWAVLPVLVVLVVLVPRWPALRRYARGLMAGFLVPTLPLALLAPGAFVHDVFVAQLTRQTGTAPLPLSLRLPMMVGLETNPTGAHLKLAVAVAIAAVALVALGLAASGRGLSRLDVTVAASAAVVALALTRPPQFYDHYAYFVAGLAAPALGAATAQLHDAVRRVLTARARVAGLVGPAFVAVVVLLTALTLPSTLTRSATYLAEADNPGPTIRRLVPPGACVVTDVPTMLVLADRFPGRDCEAPLDPFGLWLTEDGGRSPGAAPPYPAAFTAAWRGWFAQADYVVLNVDYSNYVPWDAELGSWFRAHFAPVTLQPRLAIYRRIA